MGVVLRSKRDSHIIIVECQQVDIVITIMHVTHVNVRVEVKLVKVNNALLMLISKIHVQHVPRTATHKC